MMIVKSPTEIQYMREAGRITGLALAKAGAAVKVGVTTSELNDIAHEVIVKEGAKPSFLGYNGYPASLCVSVNEQLIHGIPGKRKLKEGDIVSLDVGACIHGFHGDSAATFAVGQVSDAIKRLIETTRQCFYDAAAVVREGARIGEVSGAIQRRAENAGYSVVRQFTGHGVGMGLHEDPEVPCFAGGGRGARLAAGMTIAIEPMVNMGAYKVEYAEDRTTVITCDRSISAHYEHTVLVTKEGCELLTYIEDLSV